MPVIAILWLLSATSSAAANITTRLDGECLNLAAVSAWELSAEKAQALADEQVFHAIASALVHTEVPTLTQSLQRQVGQILRSESVLQERELEIRQRAYGTQFRSKVTASVPVVLVEQARTEWADRQLQSRHRMATAFLASPFMVVLVCASFIALDRATLGDRRPILIGAYVLMSMATSTAVYLHSTAIP